MRIKSSNMYSLITQSSVETEKLIKGNLDSNYSDFGHTVPGGNIAYRLKIKNTGNKTISKLVLLDILPSINDLGITDSVQRGSVFTPTLTGPISVPKQWENKVSILYSKSKDPKRDDLVKNTKLPRYNKTYS